MDKFKDILPKYWEKLKERAANSRVTTPHQLVGLELAQLLNDEKHKSLYIKLAKQYDQQALLAAAKKISENDNVINKGAYFMRIWFDKNKENKEN